MTNTFIKDPTEVLDYEWDWEDVLNVAETGDVILTALIVAPTGITVDSFSNTSDTVTMWLSGGTLGTYYEFSCRIVTSNHHTFKRIMVIECAER